MTRWARLAWFLCLYSLASIATAAGPDRWVALSEPVPSPGRLEVSPGSTSSIHVELTPAGFISESVLIDGREYVQLRAPGAWFPLDAGEPELPYRTLRLQIPGQGAPQVKILAQSWREIPSVPPIPSKGNLSREVDPQSQPWVFGPAYDASGNQGIWPARITRLERPFLIREARGVALRVQLVRWDPQRELLLALEHLELEVVTTAGPSPNETTSKSGGTGDNAFAPLYEQGFDNPRSPEKYERLASGGRMLVVCPAALVPSITDFVAWKRQRGLQVEVLQVEDAGGTAMGIQAFIDQLYAESQSLTYIVLVGDLEQVPTHLGEYEGALDDTRYGRVAGDDFYPDILVSRVSARNDTEARTQLNKFVVYERDPQPDGLWYARASGLASSQGIPTDAVRAGWLRDDLLAWDFTSVDEIYAPTGTTEDIFDALNAGRSLINYLGHGSGASWSNPYFHTEHIPQLTNGERMPWILDVSCNNGAFGRASCFAEAWLRAGTPEQPQGAVGMYSASTTTPWVPPTVMQAEAIHLLVTGEDRELGALCTHGIMEVLDTYPGQEGLQLVEQYNLFGDCSLVVRTAPPEVIHTSHAATAVAGRVPFRIEAQVPGLTAALSGQEILYAVGRTDPTGTVILQPGTDVPPGVDLTLTLTGPNRIPYVVTLPVLSPDGVTIEPATIPVGVATSVAVTLTDPDSGAPRAGRTVAVEGFGVTDLVAVTDAGGQVVFEVRPRFGETLSVLGAEGGFEQFRRELPVTGALSPGGAWLNAEAPSVGLADTLAANLEAVVRGGATSSGVELALSYYDLRDRVVAAGSEVSATLLPAWPGRIDAWLLQEGHDIYARSFEVIQPLRALSGTVIADESGNLPLHQVRIRGYLAGGGPGGAPVFDLESELDGSWVVPVEIPIGAYDLYASKLGYIDWMETVQVLPGGGDVEIRMAAAPRGLVSGTVTSAATGEGVYTLVEAFRADTGAKVAHVWATGPGGEFTLPALAYFEYDIVAAPLGYTPRKIRIEVDRPSVEVFFPLDPTAGSVLVVDAGGLATAQRSALDLLSEASQLGYDVTYLPAAAAVGALWPQYDLVLVSCGDETGSLTPTLKSDLLAHVAAGGKLLIEGGDVARDEVSDPTFAREVLHIQSWETDEPGDVGVYEAVHPVMSYPHALPPSMDFESTGAGSADAVVPTADAVIAGSWTNSWADASVVCFGPESLLGAGQTVFLAFDYTVLDPEHRRDLLHNAIHWLVAPDAGRASVSGTISVLHATDASGVTVRLDPGGRVMTTGSDGNYLFEGLYAGNYSLAVTKPGWSSASASFPLTQEQQLGGLDFELSDVQIVEYSDDPNLPIPDNTPAGVSCSLTVPLYESLSSIEVFLDLEHPYLADLTVEVTSPAGTTVALHRYNGADGDDLSGWFPTELTPYGVLDSFVGENMQGEWTLHVADHGPWDTGTIRTWGLRLSYAASLTPSISGTGQEDLPARTALLGNRPNPFNPATEIRFALAEPGPVRLEVFDLMGRRLVSLIAADLEAGIHTARWNGRDGADRPVASGTYFYRLTTSDTRSTGKMLLIK